MKAHDHTYEVLPLEEQKGPLQVGQSICLNSLENELILANPYISTVGTGCSDLRTWCAGESGSLMGCTEWDPQDQQEVRKILREYADVFAKDDLNLGKPQ